MTARLQEILENREDSYILPFFWLKGEDHRTILREIEKVQECGIRQLCLESRPHPDFCGDGWWDTLDFIMEEARRRGMRVWVLDDRKFPTGYANGAFEKKHPELSKVYLAQYCIYPINAFPLPLTISSISFTLTVSSSPVSGSI